MRKTKYAVDLSEAERAELRTLVGSGVAPARMLTRARILLKANQGEGGPGWTDAAIAGALEVHPTTVARVRRTYVERGWRLRSNASARIGCMRGCWMGPRRRTSSPWPVRSRRPGASAGRCGCWRTNWSGWRSCLPSRTRRCGGP